MSSDDESVDLINHPPHYGDEVQAIDLIECLSLGFHAGNAVKYIVRHEHKGNPEQDLRKALWYVKRLLDNPELHSPVISTTQYVNLADECRLYLKALTSRINNPRACEALERLCAYQITAFKDFKSLNLRTAQLYLLQALKQVDA